jgi:hypothetical protein
MKLCAGFGTVLRFTPDDNLMMHFEVPEQTLGAHRSRVAGIVRIWPRLFSQS